MQKFIWFKLAKDKRVRDPQTGVYLSPDHAYKRERAQFWLRRLDDGDVVLCEPVKEAEAKSEKEVEAKAEQPAPKKSKAGE